MISALIRALTSYREDHGIHVADLREWSREFRMIIPVPCFLKFDPDIDYGIVRGVYSSRRPNIFPHPVPISFPTRNPTFMGVYQKLFS